MTKREEILAKVPPDLLRTVQKYYNINKSKANRGFGENWLRVLIAFGDKTHPTLLPYTATEARESEKIWSGWRPIRMVLEALESDTPIAEEADHSLRPGSPEWRRAQYDNIDLSELPEWSYADANRYFQDKGFMQFAAPTPIRGALVWLDFFQDDEGQWRQAIGGSPIIALLKRD